MADFLDLSEPVYARVCHDVGSLLASLTDAIELAQTHTDTAGLTMAAMAAKDLTRRIRLVRVAWGGGGRLDLARLRDLASGAPAADRVQLDLTALPPGTVFAPGIDRLLLNLLLLAPDALPRGGTIALAGTEDGGILLRIAGPRAAWPAGFAGDLAAPTAAQAAPRGTHSGFGPWIALLAAHFGVRVALLLPSGSGQDAGPAPLLLQPAHPA